MTEKILKIFIILGFFLAASIALFGCKYKKPYEQTENCIVVDVDTIEHYGVIQPETNYIVKTSTNYEIVTKNDVHIGDTIEVRVIYMNGKKP